MTRAEQVPRGEDAAGTQRPERLTYGSLFTGIGGIDLGFDRCGMECRWQVEIDDYATRVLERHWPNVRRWRDINDFIAYANSQRSVESDRTKRERGTIPGRNWENSQALREREKCESRTHPISDVFRVDVVAGGFPCQPVSVAGNQKGDRDERWLWDQFREVVELVRPRVVLAENVPGLLSADSGRLFGNVLGDLAALGFDAEWGCIPASAFDAPHQRFRVFIIAYDSSVRCHSRWTEPAGQQRPTSVTVSGSVNAYTDNGGCKGRNTQLDRTGTFVPQVSREWKSASPTIRKSDHGVSCGLVRNRVSMLRCLGNAVVPQVAEWLGRRIIEVAS